MPGLTGNTPAPTAAVNNNGAVLASVSVNVMRGQGTLPSSRQAMAATTSYFVYAGASIIAQEHVERDATVKVPHAQHRRHTEHWLYGAGMYVSPSSGTAVVLTCMVARVFEV